MQQSSIFKIASIRRFYRFTVNLHFASAASFAPVVPSCIRYPAVPVCKKCAKMCRAKISPLKQALSFYAKPGKRSGSSPKRQLQSCLFRPSIKCTFTTMIHGRDLDNRTDTTLLAGTLWNHGVPIIFSKNFKKTLTARFVQLYALDTGGKKP